MAIPVILRAATRKRGNPNWGRPIPLDEIVAKIEAVSVESTRAAGRALLARGRLADSGWSGRRYLVMRRSQILRGR